MNKVKTARVPVLEDAFEINLAKLLAVSKRTGQALLKVEDGAMSGEVLVTATKLAVRLAGAVYVADLVAVKCLNGRLRPLLKCPGAHEGNFQALYFYADELACRRCHGLRYRSTLASCSTDRARMARQKLLWKLGAAQSGAIPDRRPYKWRRCHQRMLMRLSTLSLVHYEGIRRWLVRRQSEYSEADL